MAVQRPRAHTGGGPGGMSLTVLGGIALRRLSLQLQEAGRTDLMDELRDGVNKAVLPLGDSIVVGVPEYMPSGYAPVLAKSLEFRMTQRRGAASFVVSMSMIGKGSKKRREIRALDRGVVRHPVFGRYHRAWVAQKIRPGFWSAPVKKGKDGAVRRAVQVMQDVAKKAAG